MWWYKKFWIEVDRYAMWDRMENLKNMKPFHLSNRGGVVFAKEFVGFQKYFKDDKALMEWYQKVYPNFFTGEQESSTGGGHGAHH